MSSQEKGAHQYLFHWIWCVPVLPCCISVLGWHEQRQSDQERWRREAGQSEFLIHCCTSVIDTSVLCCLVICYSSCLSGVFSTLHGDERQDRSQRRAGLHCCGQVWYSLFNTHVICTELVLIIHDNVTSPIVLEQCIN